MEFKIIEKPDSLSWDIIHDILWSAHQENRRKGITMKYATLSGDEIRKRIDEHSGHTYVAYSGDEVVGTVSFMVKKKNAWYHKGEYAYLCFEGVKPEYKGKGAYKSLVLFRERIIKELGLKMMLLDTNEDNKRTISLQQKNGFRKIGMHVWPDHVNVIMARWLYGCPFSRIYCWYKYFDSYYSCKIKK